MNKEKNIQITKWLDTEFKGVTNPPRFFLKNNQLKYYYKSRNDRNLLLNDFKKLKELESFGNSIKNGENYYESENEKIYHKKLIFESKLVQTYDNNNSDYHHFLNPKTPRYHANMLFNKMVDYCIENELTDHLDRPLINKAFRNNFYKFCYENSDK
jgi:hypothetical protein